MLTVTSVSGNVRSGADPGDGCERLAVARSEMGRGRMRKTTDRGTDVGVSLGPGESLHDGDILKAGGVTILVEQLPERVITVRVRDGAPPEARVLVGHIIGNRHRPVAVSGSDVVFPAQAESELAVFEGLLAPVAGHVELSAGRAVFRPHEGGDVHGHA